MKPGFGLTLPYTRPIGAPIIRTDFAPVNDVKRAKQAWALATVKYNHTQAQKAKLIAELGLPRPTLDKPLVVFAGELPEFRVCVRDGFFPLRSEDYSHPCHTQSMPKRPAPGDHTKRFAIRGSLYWDHDARVDPNDHLRHAYDQLVTQLRTQLSHRPRNTACIRRIILKLREI